MRTVGSLVLLAVLLLASLGLQRFLVVCNGPHCHESIEFAHFANGCCEEEAVPEPEEEPSCCRACAAKHVEHSRETVPSGDLDRLTGSGCGCSDTPLHCENGPLPRAVDGLDDGLVGLPVEPVRFEVEAVVHQVALLPPPTGPPRTDRRTELVATTVLRL